MSFWKKNSLMSDRQKILVIQTAFIGDAILTLPMLQKLKELYPGSEVDVVSNPGTSAIFSSSPTVNYVYVLDKKKKHKSILSTIRFAKELRQKNYTRLYSPHRSYRTALIVFFSGIEESYGFDNASLLHTYKHIVKYNYNTHEVKRNLELIGLYDDNWKILPEVNINSKEQENINNFLIQHDLNNNSVAIAPGSIWNTKRYPVEYFEKIIEYFIIKDYKVILIGSRRDETLCNNLISRFRQNVVSAAGKFSVLESIGMLKKVKLLISNDSAPAHMGMCANIPVLTLYCSTSPSFGFYPYNEGSSYLSHDDLFCKPCGIHGYEKCPLKTFKCGHELLPETVISKIEEMING
jgi:heptosyltransferase-2